jgi:hypothetical protein
MGGTRRLKPNGVKVRHGWTKKERPSTFGLDGTDVHGEEFSGVLTFAKEALAATGDPSRRKGEFGVGIDICHLAGFVLLILSLVKERMIKHHEAAGRGRHD